MNVTSKGMNCTVFFNFFPLELITIILKLHQGWIFLMNIIRHGTFSALLLVFVLAWCHSAGASTVVIERPDAVYSVSEHSLFLEDKSGRLSFDDVTSPLRRTEFKKSDDRVPNFRFSRSAFWFKFTLSDRRGRGDNEQLVLRYRWPFINSITVFIEESNGNYRMVETGCAWPFDTRDIPARLFMFRVPHVENGDTTVYVRCSTRGALLFPVDVAPWSKMMHESEIENLLYGIFAGVMIMMIFFHLLMFTAIRDVDYIYFCVYIAAQMMNHFMTDGFMFRYFSFPVEYLHQWMMLLAAIVAAVIILFSSHLLNLDKDIPVMGTLFKAAAVLFGILALASFPASGFIGWRLFFALVFLITVITLVLSVIRMVQGVALAKYIFVFILLYLSSTITVNLIRLNIIPFNSLTYGIRPLSLIMQALILAYAINARIRKMERDKLAIQDEAIQALERNDRLKDEFLANTSHELRTPLHGIVGLADITLRNGRVNMPRYVRENLLLISSSGRKLLSIINDLLDFSKLKHGELSLNIKAVDLKSAVSVVFSLLSPLTEGKAIELRNRVQPDMPRLLADELRLKQVLSNLTGNAIKFTPFGVVEISARVNDSGMAEVTVSDTGIGLEKDSIERIFTPFEQGDGSGVREYGGTGLGLSITKNLVELMGGEIRAESPEQGGASFIFTLPLDRRAAERGDARDVKERAGGVQIPDINYEQNTPGRDGALYTPAILAVDDDPVSLKILSDFIGLLGYRCITAKDGASALDIISGQRGVDMVLLDVMMPGVSGYEVLKKIRKTRGPEDLPVILITAKSLIDDINAGFSAGANDYIIKPFDIDELSRRVKNILMSMGRVEKGIPGIRIKEKKGDLFIPYRDILYLSSSGKKSIIFKQGGGEEVAMLLKEIEQILPVNFLRIHRGHIINMDHVVKIHHRESWSYDAELSGGAVLPVGRTFITQLKEYLDRKS